MLNCCAVHIAAPFISAAGYVPYQPAVTLLQLLLLLLPLLLTVTCSTPKGFAGRQSKELMRLEPWRNGTVIVLDMVL